MNTKTKMVRIVAAVVDTRNLTLYKEDGETIVIQQGDPRLRSIVEDATPQLIRQGWADVVITNPVTDNSYAKFEQGGTGAVKFFRIAKDKLKNLFSVAKEPEPINTSPVPPLSIGPVPMQAAPAALPDVLPATPVTDYIATASIYDVSEADEVAAAIEQKETTPKVEQTMAAINEIMQHAVPVQSEDFHETNVAVQGRIVETNGQTIGNHSEDTASHTIIAMVDNKIIPGMEMIKTQFGRAAKLGSTIGVENFLRRLASVIEQRKHSVEDLLKFMERADLPIADDGTILIYKVLSKMHGQYVDCHSKKVTQFVGAHVCMDVALVDHNRNNECSNGLHVARRGYIREFSGDVCVLAKLAPEDVIAVPSYDANKMRVCGYHIIAELDVDQYAAVKRNQPITNTEAGKQLLAKVLAGDHIQKTHEVRITGQMGAGVVTTKLEKTVEESRKELSKRLISEVVAEALSNPEAEALDPATNPLDVVKAVEKAVLSRKEQAKALYDACATGGTDALDALHAFKRASKTSWENLGLPELNGSVFSIKTPAKPKAEAKKGNAMVPPSVFKEKNPTPTLFPTSTIIAKPETNKVEKDLDVLVATNQGSYRERIHKLLAIGLTSVGVATAIYKIKQQSRKSWSTLGVTENQVARLMKWLGKDE